MNLLRRCFYAWLLALFGSLSMLQAAPDDLDAAFMSTVNLGKSSPINAVAVEAGGTILIGGNYGTYEGSATEAVLWRLNADGSLNTVVDDFATAEGVPEINSIVVQPDGKILIGGVFDTFDGAARASILRLNSDLSLDTGFNLTGITKYLGGGYVQRVVLQSDGKVLVTGYFVRMNGVSRYSIARLNVDGTLDTGFVPALLQSNGYYGGVYPGTVDDVSVQSDGRMVISGGFDLINGSPAGNVTRLLANGSLDASFNPGVGTDYRSNRVLVLPDGRIVLGGSGSSYNGQAIPFLVALLPSGAIDTNFQGNLGSGFDGWTGGDLQLGPDGYIYVGGIFTLANGINTASIAKLSLDGTVQADFNPIPGQPRGSWGGHTYGIAHQADGKIIIVGWIGPLNPAEVATNTLTINGTLIYNIARFEGNGGAGPGTIKVITTSTSTPENGGTVTLSATRINGAAGAAAVNYSTANGTALDGSDFAAASGSLTWASGELGTQSVTITLTDDALVEGEETFSFNLSGVSGASLGDATTVVTISDDDSIPLIVSDPQSAQAVAGYPTTLSVSVSSVLSVTYQWKLDGAVIPGATSSRYTIDTVAEGHAGDYTVEVTNANGTAISAIATLDVLVPSGSIDLDFSPSLSSAVVNFTEMGDGSFLATTASGELVKVDASGAAVAGFTAPVFTLGGSAATLSAVAELSDGKLLVAGTFDSVGGSTIYNLTRLNANGSVDTSFTPFTSDVSPITAMDIDAAGNSYVGFSGGPGLAKVTSGGVIDGGFISPAGVGTGTSGYVLKLEVQPDGDLLVSSYDNQGFNSNYNRLRRINSDGSTDAGFQTFAPNWYVRDWTLLPDGRLAVVGSFNNSLPNNSDGVSIPSRLVFLDPATGEIVGEIPTPVVNNQVYSVAYNDGFLVIGGIFSEIDGMPVVRVARFRLDGTLNDSFDIAGGPDGAVSQIELDADGNIMIAGSFTQFAGNSQAYFARLNRGPGSVGFALTEYSVDEDAGTTSIPVARFGDLSGAASVSWTAVESGSAVAGVDYTAATGTLNWADGDGADQTIQISLLDNAAAEAPRDFQIVLSDASVAQIDRAEAMVTINDDDTLATFTPDLEDTSLVEGSATWLSVVVDSQTTSSYQWYKNGAPIPSATEATLAFASAASGDVGSYYVEVTNSAGTVTSEVISVSLRQPLTDVLSTNWPTFNSTVAAIAVDSAGRSYVGGGFSQVNGSGTHGRLVALLADGTLDPNFAPALNSSVSFVEVLSGGDIIIGGGFTLFDGVAVPKVARLAPDGTLNTDFNDNITPLLSGYNGPTRITVDASDRIYITGNNLTGVLKRFSADGTEDSTFTTNLTASFDSFAVSDLSIASDGSIFLLGTGSDVDLTEGYQYEYVVKLDAAGNYLPAFDADYYSGLLRVNALPDGRVLVITSSVMRRLNSDGSEDATFTPVPVYGSVYSVDSAERFYVIERVHNGSNYEYKLRRYTADGTLDPVFEAITEATFNASPSFLQSQADGSLLVSGGFTNYNGQAAAYVVRLRADLTVIDIGTEPLVVEPGATASVTATVDGPRPLSFKWYRDGAELTDGGDYSGTDTLTLEIANAAEADEGLLTLRAFNPTTGFSVTSPARELVVLGAPEILAEPEAQTIIAGSDLVLSVDVRAAAPYTIQWYQGTTALSDGGNISGATTATLTITSAAPANSGDYHAVITNSLDIATTVDVSVQVDVVPAAPVAGFTSPIAAGSSSVYDTLELADGRVLVASYNTSVGGQYRNLFLMAADGTHDASFTINPNSAVNKLYQQADGKILLVGSFTAIGANNYRYIARLNTDLSLDTNFSTNVGSSSNNLINDVATDADGRIYVGGSFTYFDSHLSYRVARLLADGQIDTTFSTLAYQDVYALSVSQYGVFIGGGFTNFGGSSYLVKLNEDGTRDTSYTADTVYRSVYSLAMQDDGKLLVSTAYIPRLIRLLPSGENDVSFSPSFTINSTVNDIEIRPNGKILIGGQFTDTGAGFSYLNQLLSDGTLDPDFDLGTGFDNRVTSVYLNSAGQIWVGGSFTTYDGDPYQNLVKLSGEPIAIRITEQPQSDAIITGESTQFSVAAIGNATLSYQWYKDGSPVADDSIYSGSDTATLSLTAATETEDGDYSVEITNALMGVSRFSFEANLLVLGLPEILTHPVSQAVLIGNPLTLTAEVKAAAPYTVVWKKNGTPLSNGSGISGADTLTLSIASLAAISGADDYTVTVTNSFGSDTSDIAEITSYINPGQMAAGYTAPVFNSTVKAILPLPSGQVLVGGSFTSVTDSVSTYSRTGLALVNADGTIDTDFTLAASGVEDLELTAVGKVLLAGSFTTVGGQTRPRHARLDTDLSLDATYAPTATPNSTVNAIIEDIDGNIWIGGAFYQYYSTSYPTAYLAKLDNTGMPVAGQVQPNNAVYDLLSAADGDIFVAGAFSSFLGSNPRLVKINRDITLDTAFSPTTSAVYSVAESTTGEVYAGDYYNVVKFSSTGVKDTTFLKPAGWTSLYQVSAIAVQDNGRVISGSVGNPYLGRQESLGDLDTTFDLGSGLNGAVYDIAIQNTGAIWVGGSFTTFNGNSVGRLIKLEGDLVDIAIRQNPTVQSEDIGTSASFTVVAETFGGEPIGYQWRKNGVDLANGGDISGATTATLTIANLEVSDEGDYDVVVTNLTTTSDQTSTAAELIVLAEPEILSLSVDQDLEVNDLLSLTVEARGADTLSYQWELDDVAIPGATAATYAVAQAQVSHSGAYTVVVSNSIDDVTSDPINVSVVLAAAAIAEGFDQVTFNSTVRTILPLGDGRTLVGGDFTQITYNSTTHYIYYLALINADGSLDTTFNLSTNNRVYRMAHDSQGRVLLGGNFTSLGGASRNRIARLNTDLTLDTSFGGSTGPNSTVYDIAEAVDGSVYIAGAFSQFNSQPNTGYVCRLDTSGALDEDFVSAFTNYVYKVKPMPNGQLIAGGSFSLSGKNYFARFNANGSLDATFAGSMNNLVYDFDQLSDGGWIVAGGSGAFRRFDMSGTWMSAWSVSVNSNIWDVEVEEDDQILLAGDFTTVAGQNLNRVARLNLEGTVDASFTLGSGANQTVYALALEPLGAIWMGGLFTEYRGVTANRITRMVGDLVDVAIAQQPQTVVIDPAATASFTVLAMSEDPLSYQWLRDGSPLTDGGDISGAATATLEIANVEDADEDAYSVIVTNSVTSATKTSTAAELIVLGAPEVLTQPEAQTLEWEMTLELEVEARGIAPLTYQWYKDDVVLADDARISGVNTPVLTITPTEVADTAAYKVIITNSEGAVTSSVVAVDVFIPPAKSVPSIALPNFNSTVLSVLPLGDGRALVAGQFSSPRAYLALVKADGTLDSTFNLSVNSTVRALKLDRSGRILLGGDFTSIGGQSYQRVARLNADLTLDTEFEVLVGPSGSVYDIAEAADGAVWIGGAFNGFTSGSVSPTYLAKLDTYGDLDASFTSFPNSTVYSVETLADGSVLVGGQFSSFQTSGRHYLAKLDAAGDLVSAFTPSISYYVYDIDVQSNGQLLVAGRLTSYLQRLNSDGTADTAFNAQVSGTLNSYVWSVDTQLDGKIVVGGQFTTYNGQSSPYIARMHADGSPDTDFDVGTGFNSTVYSVAFEPLGNVWVGGQFSLFRGVSVPRLVKLNGYEAAVGITEQPLSVSVEAGENAVFSVTAGGTGALTYQWQKNGSDLPGETGTTLTIAVADASSEGDYSVIVTNATAGISVPSRATQLIFLGAPEIFKQPEAQALEWDTTLTLEVKARGAGSLSYQWYKDDVALADDARISGATSSVLIITPTVVADSGAYKVIITNSEGSATSSVVAVDVFIPAAKIVPGISLPNFNSTVNSVLPLGDGRALVGGAFTSPRPYLALVNADGTLDSSFNLSLNNTVQVVKFDRSGRILLGGNFYSIDGQSYERVARLNADLTLDTTFEVFVGPNSTVNDLAEAADGSIWVGGSFSGFTAGSVSPTYLAKLDTLGQLDLSYTDFPNSTVYSVETLDDGSVLVGGQFSNFQVSGRNYLAKLDAAGGLVTAFAPSISHYVYDIDVQTDGKLLVAGRLASYLQRLNSDGTADSAFNAQVNGKFNSYVWSVDTQLDGKIVAVGQFTTYNSQSSPYIARMHADGSPDSGFDVGTGFNNIAYSVAIESLGNVWVGGLFSTFRGVSVPRLVKLNGDEATVGITEQPLPAFAEAGENAVFIVTAAGTDALTYQWQKNGSDLPGETGTSLTVAVADDGAEGDYSVVVTNATGVMSVTSRPAELVFLGIPEILFISDDVEHFTGETLNLDVTARGAATLSYQWNVNGAPIPGATSAIYGLADLVTSNSGNYTVTMTNGSGSITSDPIQVAVVLNGAEVDSDFRSADNGNGAANNSVNTVCTLSDGSAIVGGTFTTIAGGSATRIAKINTDGELVAGWGATFNSTVNVIREQSDGKFLVGGQFSSVNNDSSYQYLVRLNLDGTVDTSYNPTINGSVQDLELFADDSAIVVGNFNTVNTTSMVGAVKLDVSGVIDTSFKVSSSAAVAKVEIDSVGRVYFSSSSNGYAKDDGVVNYGFYRLWRSTTGGVLDTSYAPNPNNYIYDIHIAADDTLYIGGRFTTIGGGARSYLARLDVTGALDHSFANLGLNNYVFALEEDPNGYLILSGYFTTILGTTQNRIAMVDSSGALVPTFDIGSGLNNNALDIEVDALGKIWLGGSFYTYNGVNRYYLTRLNGVAVAPVVETFATFIGNTGLSGPDAAFDFDYDLDGIANGLEFLLGGDPIVANSGLMPGPMVMNGVALATGDTEDYLVLDVAIREELVSLNWSVQASEGLPFTAGSIQSAVQVGSPVIADGMATYRFRMPWSTSAATGTGFMRVALEE